MGPRSRTFKCHHHSFHHHTLPSPLSSAQISIAPLAFSPTTYAHAHTHRKKQKLPRSLAQTPISLQASFSSIQEKHHCSELYPFLSPQKMTDTNTTTTTTTTAAATTNKRACHEASFTINQATPTPLLPLLQRDPPILDVCRPSPQESFPLTWVLATSATLHVVPVGLLPSPSKYGTCSCGDGLRP